MDLRTTNLVLVSGLLMGATTPACYLGSPSPEELFDEDIADSESDEGEDDAGPVEGCDDPTSALIPPMRRLTATEYRYTVLDLLGVDSAELVSTFPADPRIDGFDNNAAAQTIGLAHATAYQSAAEWIADRVLEDPMPAIGCDPDQPACLDEFIETTAPLLWRRPLSEVERERLFALADRIPDAEPAEGLSLVLRAMLQSPHFLWRPEPEKDTESLNGFDIATRLSYFLWQSAPDADLWDRAAAGELDTAEGMAEAARAIWSDPRATRGRAGFTAGWLRSAQLQAVVRDPELYPEWTPELRQALTNELAAMVEHHATADADFLDVLVSPIVPLSEQTAPLYGVPLPLSSDQYEFDDPWRGGLLSTAAVMATTSPGDITSPVSRGVWIREAILCEPLPPPPPDVEADPTSSGGEDKASQLEAHREDPACTGCHARVDPIGLGLERYDALGRLRDLDELGQPPTTAGRIEGIPDSDFEGALELGQRLQNAPQTRACVATQMFRWAHGRTETPDDACALETATEQFEQTGRLEDLAVALITPAG